VRAWRWIVAAFAALAGGIAWLVRNGSDEHRTEQAREAAQERQREDIADKLAAERLAIQERREREREAMQDELDTDLLQVENDLPGAVADALRDARGSGDDTAG